MSNISEIKDYLIEIVGIKKLPTSKLCTVVSVDEDEMTCEVTPIDEGANFMDVRLMADGSSATGIYFKPAIGSIVMISPQDESTYFVSMYSDIDEVWLRGTANGGVVKVSDLVTKLNNLENKVNTIITWGATVTPALATPPLIATVAGDIQSTTVKHG